MIRIVGVAVLAAVGALVMAQESKPVSGNAAQEDRRSQGGRAVMESTGTTGFLFKMIRAQDREYRYAVYVPREYDAGKAWPVVVFLHGRGECGTDGSKQLAQGIGTAIMLSPERWPAVVVFPQKPDGQSRWEDHDAAVMAMVERAKAEFNVDEKRLYLTGLSQGGHGTWAIAANHPEMWAAIAPIFGYGEPKEIAEKVKDIPTWCFHGEADNVVPAKQTTEMVAAIEAAGGKPKMSIFPGVNHNSWDKAYREETLAEWMFGQKK